MLSSLLSGISPGLFSPSPVNANGFAGGAAEQSLHQEQEQEPRPGVVLRREQVRLVLFEGKSVVADVEDPHGRGHGTLTLSSLLSHHFDSYSFNTHRRRNINPRHTKPHNRPTYAYGHTPPRLAGERCRVVASGY
jgi:hypothetical protein